MIFQTIIGILCIALLIIYLIEKFDYKEKRLFQVSDMLTFVDKIIYYSFK